MSIPKTYEQGRPRWRSALVAAAAALVLTFAGVGATSASAWASVASGALGINVEVPSTVEQRPGSSAGEKTGTPGVLGVNLDVPEPTQTAPDGKPGNTGAATGASTAVLGVNLSVPPTIEQATGGSDGKHDGSSAVLGVNLQVPDPVDDGDPDSPGTNTGGKVSGAAAVLGVNLEVPSTVQQAAGEGAGGGSEAVLGVNLKVPESENVTFYGNGGRGTYSVAVSVGHGVDRPDDSRFFWPGRHITGWYADASCTGDPVAFPLDDETLKQSKRFYAKWEVDDPRAVGGVELHLVESAENGGNATGIDEAELSGHGIVGDGEEPDGYVAAGADDDFGAPVYEGRYYPGGDGTVWPLPEDASAEDEAREGATLELPTPYMDDSADGMRSGWFDGWYRSCEPVLDAEGNPVLDETGYPAYAYSDPVRKVGDHWVIDRYDTGSGASGEPAYQQVLYAKWRTGQKQWFTFDANGGAWADGDVRKQVKIQRGEPVPADAVDEPVREGYTFHAWHANSPDGPVWSFSNRVMSDTTVYAGWTQNEYVVAFDAAGGAHVADRRVKHGETVAAPTTTRPGYAFCGWWLDADGDGAIGEDESLYDFASPVTGPLKLVAKWAEEGPGPAVEHTVTFDAGKGAFEGAGSSTASAKVADGETVAAPDPAPKRPGWQFAGWYLAVAGGAPEGWDDGGASAVPLGGKWDFASPVTGDTTLHAKWDLRLDVTVPVSVGFAVDAGTLEVTTPDEGRYAFKSRTVKPVTVDEAAVASEEAELGGFFEPADASEGWGPALRETELSLAPQGGSHVVALALAGDAPAEGGAWENAYELTAEEKAAFAIGAFSYEGISFDEGWRGSDPSEVLPLKLGMTISDKLRVRTALDGPQKITHLRLTVSAEA